MDYMSFYSGYCDGVYLWTISNQAPILFKIALKQWVVIKAYLLPTWLDGIIYKQVIRVSCKLYFFPLEGNKILLFDLNTEEFGFVMDKENDPDYAETLIMIGDVKEDDKHIYLIPKDLRSPFYIIEKKRMSKFVHKKWTETVKQNVAYNEYKTTLSALWRGKLYTPISGTDNVVIFDIEKDEVIIQKIKIGKNKLFAFAESEHGIIVNFENSSQIIIWDSENNKVQFCYGMQEKGENVPFYRCIWVTGKIVALPYIANDILIQILDIKKEACNSVTYPKDFEVLRQDGTTFYGFFTLKGHLCLLPLRGNRIVDIEIKSGEAQSQRITFSNGVNSYLNDLFGEKGERLQRLWRTKEEIYGLLLKIDDYDRKQVKHSPRKYGSIIWDNILNYLD